MHLAIVTTFLGVSVGVYCPPCGTRAALTQMKLAPYANVPPPAPDAPVTACGCGVDKVTPREELQEMSSADQRRMIGELGKETASLQEQVDKLNKEHTAVLDKLKARLEKAENAEKKQRRGIEESQQTRNSDRQEAKDKIDKDQEELEVVSNDIAKQRATLKELQSDLTILLMASESCDYKKGCPKEKFLFTQNAKSAAFSAAQLSGNANAPLYMEIEGLEEKRNALNEELTDEMGSFGMKHRSLLHRIDMVEKKMNRQDSKADKYEHTDASMAKLAKRQGKEMGDYLAHKKAQLERVLKDVKAAKAKYADLETEMGKCGCGPKA